MSDVIHSAVIEVGVDGSGVDAGMAKIDSAVARTGKTLESLGGTASAGFNQIGAGGDGAAKKVDAATRYLASSIQRTAAAMETGKKGSVAYFEALANSRGANMEVLRPYLAQLDALASKTRIAAEAQQKLDDSTKFLDALKNRADGIGKTASQLAEMRAAQLGVSESAQPLIDRMREAEESAGGLRGALGAASGALKAFAIAAAGALSFGALVAGVKSAIDTLAELDDVAQKTGSTVENLSRLQKVASMTGVEFGNVDSAISKLAKGMATVDSETSKVQKALKAVGVSSKDAAGHLRDPSEVLVEVAKNLQNYADGAGKTALATDLLGKAGADLLPYMNDVADSVDKFAGSSTDAAKMASELQDQLGLMRVKTNELFNSVATDLLPTFNDFVAALIETNKESADLNSGGAIASWADTAAIGAARLIDVLKLIPSTVRAVAGSFESVYADISLLSSIPSAPKIAYAAATGGNAIADFKTKLAERNKIVEDSNKRYDDLWNKPANTMEQAILAKIDARTGVNLDARDMQLKQLANTANKAAEAGKKALDYTTGNDPKAAAAASAIQKEANAYASLIASIKEKTEVNKLELLVGINATDSQKTGIKLDQDLASGKLKLSAAHIAAARAALVEQSASESLLKAKETEKDVTKYIEQSTIARKDSAAQLVVEYELYGKSNDARAIAMVAVKEQTAVEKFLLAEKSAGKVITEDQIKQLNAEADARVKVEQAAMAQGKALGYASQLRDENKKFGAESIFDEKDRARALLEIDAGMWQERIKLAGDGTEAQKQLQTEYSQWYANQLNKPAIEEWKKSVAQYDDVFRKGFADMVNGGKGAWKSFTTSLVTTFKTTVADQIYKMFAQPFVVRMVASLLGVTGSAASGVASAAGAASDASGALSAINTLSSIKTAYSAITTGISATIGSGIASAGALFGSSAMSAFGTGMTMSTASAAAATGAGAVSAGVGVTGAAGTAMGAGASAATAIPIVGWIAAAMMANNALYSKGYTRANADGTTKAADPLNYAGTGLLEKLGFSGRAASILTGNSLVNKLFGYGNKEIKSRGIEGSFGGDGFSGKDFANWQQDGGWFRSDKSGHATSAMAAATQKQFTDGFSAIKSVSSDFARSLGMDAGSIATYSKKISVSLTGNAEADAAAIAGMFAGMGEDIAKSLLTGTTTVITQAQELATKGFDAIAGKMVTVDHVATQQTGPDYSYAIKENESYSAALQRLSVSLSAVNGMFDTLNVRLYDASIAGGDMASKLADLFGGLDNMKTVSAGYFQAFYSEQEKVDIATRQLSKTFADLGFAMPASNAELRAQIEAQQALGESGQKSFVQLMGLSGSFAALTSATEQLSAATGNAAEIAKQRRDMEIQIMELQGNAAGALAARRAIEIDAMDATLHPLQQMIYGLQDIATAADTVKAAADAAAQSAAQAYDDTKAATNAALQAVQRAIDAEKSRIGVIRDVAAESVRSITSVFDLLKDQVSQLYGTVESTSAMQAAQGNAFIDQALATVQSSGYMPDQKELQDAITAARGGLDSSQFKTQIDADVAALVMAGKLSQLQTASGYQLTAAEQALKIANDQLTALDSQLDYAQKQVDALNGINTSVLSVTAAIAGLATAIYSQVAAKSAVSVGSGASSSTGAFNSNASVDASHAAVNAYGAAYGGDAYYFTAGVNDYAAKLANATTAAAQIGVSIADAFDLLGHSQAYWQDMQAQFDAGLHPTTSSALLNGSHANGLDSVPFDGYRAELHKGEMVLPAHVAQSVRGGGGNNDELLAELRAQRAENKEMAARLDAALYAIAKNTMQTADTVDSWDGAGMPITRVDA